ncbi:MAG: polyprenyl synthetase family protein [Candidatus Hodarchaeota archaeon]
MSDSSFSDVFTHMSKLSNSVEPIMLKFLLKDVHTDFKDLVQWQTKTGGKRLRPALTLLFSQAFGASDYNPEALAAAAGIELIHTYSLILDDIIDRGDLRRGEPTVRAKYGDEFAILAAIIHREAIYEAARATGRFFDSTIRIYSETIRRLTEGERLDILFERKEDRHHEYFLNHRYSSVTQNDYRKMIVGKTAALLAAACKLGAIIGGASLDEQVCSEKFGWASGIAFQIADDYLDIFAVSKEFGKEVYKDIIEQKLGNFVVVQALRLLDQEKADQLKKFLTDPSLSDEERILKCMPLIEVSTAKEMAMKEAEKWAHKAKMVLSTISLKNEDLRAILEKLAEFAVRRAF